MSSLPLAEENPRTIDIWGFLRQLWAHKLLWVTVFAIVFAAGAAFALTRPPVYKVSQAVMLEVPATTNQAEAIQQAGFLEGASVVFSRLIVIPPVTDAVLAGHPEVDGLADLQERVLVVPTGNSLLEISAEGSDPDSQARLARDLASNFIEELPMLTAGNPANLRVTAALSGDPAVTPVSSGRTFLLAAAFAAAALLATAAASLWSRRRS